MSRFATLDLNVENNKVIIIIVLYSKRTKKFKHVEKYVYLKSMKKLFMASNGSEKAQKRPKSLYHDDDNDAT